MVMPFVTSQLQPCSLHVFGGVQKKKREFHKYVRAHYDIRKGRNSWTSSQKCQEGSKQGLYWVHRSSLAGQQRCAGLDLRRLCRHLQKHITLLCQSKTSFKKNEWIFLDLFAAWAGCSRVSGQIQGRARSFQKRREESSDLRLEECRSTLWKFRE